jgi:hypothetical protein
MTADLYAELVVAACAAATPRGAQLAHERLDAGDFTSGTCAAIFAASIDLSTHPLPSEEQAVAWARARLAGGEPASIWPSELRLQEIARRLDIPVADLEEFVNRRVVHEDVTGKYAERVQAAARQRRLQAAATEVHEAIRTDDHQRAGHFISVLVRELEKVTG